MTHDDAFVFLLRGPRFESGRESDARRAEALRHVASCRECLALLCSTELAATGTRSVDASEIERLFVCEPTRRVLFRLGGFAPDELATRFPDAARHLAWCVACRERLADVLALESDADDGAPDYPPTTPWRRLEGALGSRGEELLGRVLAVVRRGVAAFVDLPPGVAPVAFATPQPLRRSDGENAGTTGIQRVRIELRDRPWCLEVGIDAPSNHRCDLEVQLDSSGAPATIAVRIGLVPFDSLGAVQPTRAGMPLWFRDLATGAYVLEVRDDASGERFRVPLVIEVQGE